MMTQGGYRSWEERSADGTVPGFMRARPIPAESLPTPLRQALTRVEADFHVATDLECVWWFEWPEDDADGAESEYVMCHIATDSAYGFSIDLDSEEEEASERIADEGTEQVFETLGETVSWDVAERWPRCPRPGHEDHGIAPDVRRGRAVWICQDGIVAEIGRLRDWYDHGKE